MGRSLFCLSVVHCQNSTEFGLDDACEYGSEGANVEECKANTCMITHRLIPLDHERAQV